MSSEDYPRWTGWLVVLLAVLVFDGALTYRWWRQRLERRADGWIRDASQRYRVDPALVKAVVWRESRFRPEVRGRDGEWGLMQVGPLAAAEWAAAEGLSGFQQANLADPRTNVLAGTWYLGRLLLRYPHTDQPAVYALADYNAGRSNVRRWLSGAAATNGASFLALMDFPTTREYVRSVLERRELYRKR